MIALGARFDFVEAEVEDVARQVTMTTDCAESIRYGLVEFGGVRQIQRPGCKLEATHENEQERANLVLFNLKHNSQDTDIPMAVDSIAGGAGGAEEEGGESEERENDPSDEGEVEQGHGNASRDPG